MLTPEDMQKQANTISAIYSSLEDKIFQQIIHALTDSRFSTVTKENVLLWQAEQLKKMGMLNHQVIHLLAKETKKTKKEIEQLIRGNGHLIIDQVDKQLAEVIQKK